VNEKAVSIRTNIKF